LGFKKELNPQQYEAVTHESGPLLILAGAGSGKTRVIAYRIAYLVQRCNIHPSQILGVTFTNKAANEMRQRITSLIGKQSKELTLGTFHSLGLRILRLHCGNIGYRPNFNIYGEGDQLSIIRTLIREHPQKNEKFDAGILLSQISNHKNNAVDGNIGYPTFGDKYDLVFSDIYEGYQQQLRACQAVDFDDLILLPIQLLKNHADVRTAYRIQYKYLLVDEYQDTNHGQYKLIQLLAGKDPNLCVVGDDDQSIYGWRGAQVENILRFEKDFPNSKVIKLEQNYRSTQVILDAAHHVIKNNYKRQSKKLWTARGRGRNIDAFVAQDENDESKTIAWRIRTIKENANALWSDFAVLYRSNLQSRAIESAMRINEIPYEVVGGYEYFERKEVKDIVAYLRTINNPSDDLSLLRIVNYPRRGIGNSTIVKLSDEAHARGVSIHQTLNTARDDSNLSKQARSGINSFVEMIDALHENRQSHSIPDLVKKTIEHCGYRDELMRTIDDATTVGIKIEMVEELVSAATAFVEQRPQGKLIDFIDAISLGDEPRYNNDKRKNKDSVLLVTLHSAKGLEFPYVFLCGMEEDLLPHSRSITDVSEVDEERRLCYVGMTRAQRHLTLSFTKVRNKFGRKSNRKPSRFVKEIPEHFLCKQFSHSPFFFDKQKLPDINVEED